MENKVKLVMSNKSWIESNAVEQLNKTANLEGIIKSVGLPDLHMGKMPVGAAFVTKDVIYPHIIGNDIGCGMSLFITSMKKKKFKIDKVKKKLENVNGINNISIEEYIEGNFAFRDSLGTIGGGNHFGEFQEVDKIYNEKYFNEIGLDKDRIMLLVHSGSRAYGQDIFERFIDNYNCQNGLKKEAESFNNYITEHNDAVKWAIKNRELIAYRILSAVNCSNDYTKLLDSTHNSVTAEVFNGETFYIHRKGAAPSNIGAVVVAGSRGTLSYVVKPQENLWDYALSISHGAGRKWSRFGCKEKLENKYTKKSIRQSDLGSSLICNDKNLLYEEAPDCYKNIDIVIQDMIDEGMIEVIAALKPLLTYKV